MGARLGVEPRLLGNESSVLPLDDPAIWEQWLESNQLLKDNETRDLTACPHCYKTRCVFRLRALPS